MSFTKCDTSTKHDAFLDRIRKNISILKTIQCINTRLSPLCCRRPAHSTDICIIGLEVSTLKKTAKSTVQLKRMRLGRYSGCISQCPYNNENQACDSRVYGLLDVAENSPKVASEKQQGVASNNIKFSNIAMFEFYFDRL